MRLEAEFTSEPFHGEGSPPEHALAARDAAAEAGLDTDFGPLGTLARGDAKALLEALPAITQAAFDGGATLVTLQVRLVGAAAARGQDRPGGPTGTKVSAAEQRTPTGTRAAEPHTTGDPVGDLHKNGTQAGESPTPGTQAGGSRTPGSPDDESRTPASPDGESRTPGSPDDESRTPASPDGESRTPGSPDDESRTPASPDGESRTPGSPESEPRTTGGQAGKPHVTGSAPAVELNDALARLIADVERELGAGLGELDRPGKQRAVRLLRERGAFGLRKSVSSVADALGVTRFTVYNYLNREAD